MITLRKAQESDSMFYFELKNDADVRASAFDGRLIDLKTHKAWFLSKLKDLQTYLFVIEVDGMEAGQIRIDIDHEISEIDISLTPAYRGRGYSLPAIKQACEKVFAEVLDLTTIFAHIKTENIASIKSFKKAGFVDGGVTNYKKHKCVELSLQQPNRGT